MARLHRFRGPRPAKRGRPAGGRWRGRLLRALLLAALVLLAGGALAWQTCGFEGCPNPDALVAYQPGAAPVLYDRDGRELATLSPSHHALVRIDSLPDYVPEAFVAVEDRRFYQHGAIDFRRIIGAALADLRAGGAVQGASTITMQLARNLFPHRLPGSQRTLSRKLLEARVALSIAHRFSKRQILELYLNHVYFGDGDYGIDAAARDYFGHPATRLSLPEAATLAGVLRDPAYYDPRTHPVHARDRRDLVLSLMVRTGAIDSARARLASRRSLGVRPTPPTGTDRLRAGYFVQAVRELLEKRFGGDLYGSGLRVYTTLDRTAQAASERQLDDQLSAIGRGEYGPFRGPRYARAAAQDSAGSPYLQGAVVAMDAHTGDVLALVGGRDFRESSYDRALYAHRQVGSAFKPFVYAAALEQGYAPSQLIADEPFRVRLGGHRSWSPTNYEGNFEGLIPMRRALMESRNVPTARLAQAVGTRRIAELAHRLGVTDAVPTSPSMALGTASLTPLELVAAYTSFATLGTRARPRLIRRVEDARGDTLWQPPIHNSRDLDPAVAFVLTDMLRQVVDHGTGVAVRTVGFRGPAAGKTGTTQDGRDAWFVGYTPNVVAGVWIGFDRPRRIMAGATGGRLAAPVWGRIMRRIDAERPSPWPWSPPGGVVFTDVDPATGRTLRGGCVPDNVSSQREVFVAGHVPEPACPRMATVGTWISSLFHSIFGGSNRTPQPSAPSPDDTPVTAAGRLLGARVLPGTVSQPDATGAGWP